MIITHERIFELIFEILNIIIIYDILQLNLQLETIRYKNF